MSGRIAANPPAKEIIKFLFIAKIIKIPNKTSTVTFNMSEKEVSQSFCLKSTLYSLCGMKSNIKWEKKVKNNPKIGFWVFVTITAPVKIWQTAIIRF